MLFDRICRENGIRHLLTAPRSPTTTGKVERFHKTLRREFLDGKTFTCLADAQASLDAWVREYNFERPHQSLGMAVPWDRFALAASDRADAHQPAAVPAPPEAAGATRRVGSTGLISFAGARYGVRVWLAGEAVMVVCEGGLVHFTTVVCSWPPTPAVIALRIGLRRRRARPKRPHRRRWSATRAESAS